MGRVWFTVLLSTVLNMVYAKDAELIVLPTASHFYVGEDIHVICYMEEGDSEWSYTLKLNGRPVQSGRSRDFDLVNLTVDLSGEYQCVASEQGFNRIKESNVVSITVSADKPKAFLTMHGDRVLRRKQRRPELTCSVNDSKSEWRYDWTIEGDEINMVYDTQTIRVSDVGKHTCRGTKRLGLNKVSISSEDSNAVYIERELSDKATAHVLESYGPDFFPGETIIVKCELDLLYDWSYEWRTTSLYAPPAKKEFIITSASEAHSGGYWCKGRYGSYSFTEWSPALTITVTNSKPTAELRASSAFTTNGANVFLTCSVAGSQVWPMFFFKYSSDFTESFKIRGSYLNSDTTSVESGGVYFCRGGRGDPLYFTENSNAVTIEHKASYDIGLSVQPNWLPLFSGEAVTVTCSVYEAVSEKWFYEWSRPNTDLKHTDGALYIPNATAANSGTYRCQAIDQQDPFFTTEWSHPITLVVLANSPKADLSAETRALPAEGVVTLICSVSPSSSGWEYYWYKDTQSTLLKTTDAAVLSVTDRGRYWCRGGRGSPVYYTQFSETISIQETNNTKRVTPDNPVNEGEKSESTPFNSAAMAGVACVLILLIVLPLIVLVWYKTIRERQQNRNAESSAGGDAQNVTVDNQQLYSSLLYGDANVYESIHGAMPNGSDDRDERL